MTKRKTAVIIVFSVLLLIIVGGFYFLKYFFSAFAPPKITITENYISTNHDFINGVTIEKLQVDSIGHENYPVKYAVTYRTQCAMIYPGDKPPEPPSRIYFRKEGKYLWMEENLNTPYIHEGLTRTTVDTTNITLWNYSNKRFKTCPIKIEKEQWYFVTISDPKVIGIFFYIDSLGKKRQYLIPSGVSPI